MKKDFEIIPHTADLKIKVYGETLPKLFRNALEGMFQSIRPQTKQCVKQEDRLICKQLPINRDIELSSLDLNALLVDFLSEALYLSDVHNEAYLEVTIHELNQTTIKATLHGIAVDGFEVVEIKAVTFHDLDIRQQDGIWQTNIVFDI